MTAFLGCFVTLSVSSGLPFWSTEKGTCDPGAGVVCPGASRGGVPPVVYLVVKIFLSCENGIFAIQVFNVPVKSSVLIFRFEFRVHDDAQGPSDFNSESVTG